MTRRRVGSVVVLLALATSAYVAYANDGFRAFVTSLTQAGPAAKTGKMRIPPAPVRVARAGTQDVAIRLEGIGNAQARSTVAIKSRIDGQLFEAAVDEGQMVRKGDTLFRLDARPFETQLKQAQANLSRDRANLAKAQGDLTRVRELAEQGYTPKTRLEEVETSVATFQAAIRASEAAIEMAKLNVEYAEIRSPIDGRVGSILVTPGNMVRATDMQPLLIINEVKPIYVSFSVPEQHIDELRRRMATAPLRVEAMVQGDNAEAVGGELFFINNAVDTATGTIQLLAKFPNADERLVPGQFVKASVTLTTLKDATVVPSRAVQLNQKGEYVWVVKEDNSAELRSVTIGPDAGAYTVVTGGLKTGETVVIDGQLRLFPGARVAPAGDTRHDAKAKGQS